MFTSSLRAAFALLLLAGCGATWKATDVDGDGYTIADGDCWESTDPAGTSSLTGADINPGATESWYDGVDQDCAGDDDYDADGDGALGGDGGDDCDDNNADAYPGGEDVWYDGVDGDCSGGSDYDQDGDGYEAAGYLDGADCDDLDASVSPGSDEVWYDGVDQNCDGNDDDQDGDGYPRSSDCDDTDATLYPDPDVEEIWYNGYDENCDGNDGDQDGDGYVDAGYAYDWTEFNAHVGDGDCWDDPAASSEDYEVINDFDALSAADVNPAANETWYDGVDQDCAGDDDFDADGDSWPTMYWNDRSGAPAGEDCLDNTDDDFENPAGLSETAVNPSAADDWYDGTDANCDGLSDYDQDADGFDSEDYGGTDCEDGVPSVNTAATETCATSYDDDCDGDDNDQNATDCTTYYNDSDGDSYGTTTGRCYCETTSTYTSTLSTDCDDSKSAINPAATEVCDSANTDEDCDSKTDDNDSSVSSSTKSTWYLDSDSDSYGDSASTTKKCDLPTGYVADKTDCNDSDSAINPGATEVCDSANTDEDCDSSVDDADTSVSSSTKSTWYRDADSDGYGTSSTTTTACDIPTGYVSTSTDCDDADSARSPGLSEVCDASNKDEDCDSLSDDDDSTVKSSGKTTWYRDADSDSYGTSSTTVSKCDVPSGYVSTSTDCDDADSARSPGLTEVCDSSNKDENCNSLADDADSTVSSATKSTWYRDADDDGYGVSTTTTSKCDLPSGYSSSSTDCDDADDTSYPGATEVCYDGEINDCSGTEAAALASCALYGSDDLSVFKYVRGATASDALGDRVAYAGDVTGDGYDEYLVAATAAGGGNGYVYLINGSKSVSASPKASDVDVLRLAGDATNDALGTGMSAGDFDGDGLPDLALGAPFNNVSAGDDGAVYLISIPGTTDSAASALADTLLAGNATQDRAGCDVAMLGDVDGDGKSDILVGAERNDTSASNAGIAYLVLTPFTAGTTTLSSSTADLLLTGEGSGDNAGNRVGAAGDVDGDGRTDMLVGALKGDSLVGPTTDSGKVYLILADASYSGATLALSAADFIIRGTSSSDLLGTSVAGVGDLDGDGYDDFAVGSPYEDDSSTDAGAVGIMMGKGTAFTTPITLASADALLYGGYAGDAAGQDVDAAGDINADGYADIIIGAPGNDDGGSAAGAAYLMYGPVSGTTTLSSADETFIGETAADAAGTAVGSAGDRDNDGYDDLLIGAPGGDHSVTNGGSVHLPIGSGY